MTTWKEVDDQYDLDKIDAEIRMEKVRQNASKLTWDSFGQSLRRNLQEKKITYEAEQRKDMINAMSILRRNAPITLEGDLSSRMKQLAESMECGFTSQASLIILRNADVQIEIVRREEQVLTVKIGYFGEAPTECSLAKKMLEKNEIVQLRASIYEMLDSVPLVHNANDKLACTSSMQAVTSWLSHASGSATWEKIHSLPNGWMDQPNGLITPRIYYFVGAAYMANTKRKVDTSIDLNHLAHLELSLVTYEKPVELPTGGLRDPYGSTKTAPACFCFKFSEPMIFNQWTWAEMQKFLAKHSAVKQHVNYYRHTSGYEFDAAFLCRKTNLPPQFPQHIYNIPNAYFKDEKDVVIGEFFLKDLRDLDKVIALIRQQSMHNTLWTSFLTMTEGRFKGGNAIEMRVSPTDRSFDVQMAPTDSMIFVASFAVGDDGKWTAKVKGTAGTSINEDIDTDVTKMMNRSHSIPCALTRVCTAFGFSGKPVAADPKRSNKTNNYLTSHILDKVPESWLPRPKPPKKKKEDEYVLEIEDEPAELHLGLLRSFREVEEFPPLLVNPVVPSRYEVQQGMPGSRIGARLGSEAVHAIDQLEAICQIGMGGGADQWDASGSDGNKSSTSGTPFGHGGPMSVGTPMGLMRHDSSGSGFGQFPPMRPTLEMARQRMAQGIGAASAMAMATGSMSALSTPTGDVYDFSDDKSGSGSPFMSPSPGNNPFGLPASSPLMMGAQPMRGAATKRRPRARKTGNMGDRTPSYDSPTGIPPHEMMAMGMNMAANRKPRGKTPAVRRPRGARKSSGLPTHSEMEQRPMLQRSFSEFTPPNFSFPSTPNSEKSMPSPFVDLDSDDDGTEFDPPAPPPAFKQMLMSQQSHQASSQQMGQPPPYQQPGPGVSPMYRSMSMTMASPAQISSPSPAYPSQAPGRTTPQHLPPIPSPLAVSAGAQTPFSGPTTPTTTTHPPVVAQSMANQPQTTIVPLSMASHGGPPQLEAVQPLGSAGAMAQARAQQLRKNSLDAIKPKAQQPAPQAVDYNKKAIQNFNDLYDDGTESPPPPQERLPGLAGPSASASGTEGNEANTGDVSGSQSTASPATGLPKLIVKIKPPSSRQSPSVEVQKAKGTTVKAEKERKRKEKEKDKEREKEKKSRDSLDRTEDAPPKPKKRKAESKERPEKEGKRHKSASTSSSLPEAPIMKPSSIATIIPNMNALKKFKIPKREEPAKEKDVPTTPTTPGPAPPSQISPAQSDRDMRNREAHREDRMERDRRDERERPPPPGAIGGPGFAPHSIHNKPIIKKASLSGPPPAMMPPHGMPPHGPPMHHGGPHMPPGHHGPPGAHGHFGHLGPPGQSRMLGLPPTRKPPMLHPPIDPRDNRDPRDLRDPRDVRDPRDPRDLRDPRDPRRMPPNINLNQIPMPQKGPPPPQSNSGNWVRPPPTVSHGAGNWVRPPAPNMPPPPPQQTSYGNSVANIPPPRSPSPDPNAMCIDDDPSSPDALRIADE